MKKYFFKYLSKLFIQQWTIGVAECNIKDIIRDKSFDPGITWLPVQNAGRFYADPFIIESPNKEFIVFVEDYSFSDKYGKISQITVDRTLHKADHKMLLDTKSHLSYPFIFSEEGRVFVFPESSQTGKLCCYEYDTSSQELTYLSDILEKPLLDGTIIKHKNKYWLFGATRQKGFHYELHVFFSDRLSGPYKPHPANPVKKGVNGVRPAGNFIEVDGVIYRPAQNNEKGYGDSITINKINVLDDLNIKEEFYMTIKANKDRKSNRGIRSLHTINGVNDLIFVDGMKWRFSPATKFKQLLRKINPGVF